MSILEIEKRIIEDAEAEASRIKSEAEQSARQLEKVHAQKKDVLRRELMEDAQRRAEELKRSYLVPAKLNSRKAVLEEKQKILEKIYSEIKRAKKFSDAEIKKLREESEIKAANILFG